MRVPGRLAPLVAGRRVLVVDDLVTTGATLREAARALGSAGAWVPAAAVVAATARTRRGGVSPRAAGV
jgi:predicted amidophosphoribosyltransferase